MTLFNWSQTPNDNQTADSTINWREGQAPSSLNDSARGMMAAVAKYRDDLGGALQQGGTASAYTVSSNQNLAGALVDFRISFQINDPNNSPVTLSVDGGTAKPLRYVSGSELPANLLRAGMIVEASYFSATSEWILINIFDPLQFIPAGQLVPTGSIQDYIGASAPAGYVLASGRTMGNGASAGAERANDDTQALFTLLWNSISSLTVAPGGRGLSASADFSANKTIALPDMRGRVLAGKDNMGGSAAGNITGGTTLGATGGEQTHVLTTPEIPAHNHGVTDPGHTHTYLQRTQFTAGSGIGTNWATDQTANTGNSQTGISIQNAGGGGSHNNLQPYMLVNKIIKL